MLKDTEKRETERMQNEAQTTSQQPEPRHPYDAAGKDESSPERGWQACTQMLRSQQKTYDGACVRVGREKQKHRLMGLIQYFVKIRVLGLIF